MKLAIAPVVLMALQVTAFAQSNSKCSDMAKFRGLFDRGPRSHVNGATLPALFRRYRCRFARHADRALESGHPQRYRKLEPHSTQGTGWPPGSRRRAL